MEIVETHLLIPDKPQSPDEVYWTYNGLDCCITYEVKKAIEAKMDDVARHTYQRALDLQAPVMDMMLRGLTVDHDHRKRQIVAVEAELKRLEDNLNRLVIEGIGMPNGINARSPLQVGKLFFEVLNVPHRGKPKTDRPTLEKLATYFIAEPFVNHILAIRDCGKALGFLRTPTDADGKMRASFNLAGTNTGRMSSAFSDFGTGTNLQNVDRLLRYIFVAEPGKILVNIDLEQADSRNVGALCWQYFYETHGPEIAGAYLNACESGDLHTFVARMGWKDRFDWPEDKSLWRAIANTVIYRDDTVRDLAKKLGHGTNYYGKPPTMASHTKVPVKQIAAFQVNYFGAFPCIPMYHEQIITELKTTGQLTTPWGRRRMFFDRLDGQSTINAAIAYQPQSMTGEQINDGLIALWKHKEQTNRHPFELLVQVHDSILFQVDQDRVDEMTSLALQLMPSILPLKGGRDYTVPLEAEVGWNWGKASKSNPLGLVKWKGNESRTPPKRKPKYLRTLKDFL